MGRNMIVLMAGRIFCGGKLFIFLFLVETNSNIYKSVSCHPFCWETSTSRCLNAQLFANHYH